MIEYSPALLYAVGLVIVLLMILPAFKRNRQPWRN
jgi:hypothetical protein